MFARTERLLLRPGFPEDAPALAAAIADEAIVRNLAVVPWPYSVKGAEAFLARPRDPVLPALLILGAVGISNVRDWFARRGWSSVYNWSWAYFVVVNTLLLGIGSIGLIAYCWRRKLAA